MTKIPVQIDRNILPASYHNWTITTLFAFKQIKKRQGYNLKQNHLYKVKLKI